MPAVLQRGPNLPPPSSAWSRVCWPLDGPCREVTLLSDYRRDLVKQPKRVVNRLRWHQHELDPTLQIPPRGLRRYCVIDPLTEMTLGRGWLPGWPASRCATAAT
jgi:hypothetical protein